MKVIEITPNSFGTITVDFNYGEVFKINLNRNIILDFKNQVFGGKYTIFFKQDATGGRTVTTVNNEVISVSPDKNAVSVQEIISIDDKIFLKDIIPYVVTPTAKTPFLTDLIDVSGTINILPAENCTIYLAIVTAVTSVRTKAQIQAGTGAADYDTIDATGGTVETSNFSGLSANTSYRIDYYMVDEDENESAVLSYSFKTHLATPVITATADGTDTIDVTWSNVTGNVGYEIEASDDGDIWETPIALATNAVTYSEEDLEPATTRYYRLKALGNGTTTFDSPVSEEANDTTES